LNLATGIGYFLTFLLIIIFFGICYFILKHLGVLKPKVEQLTETDKPTGQPGFFHGLTTGIPRKLGLSENNFKLVFGMTTVVIASRVLIFLIGSMAIILFTNRAENIFNLFEFRWYKADSPLYINIAQNWYVNHGDDRFLIVFYPLYPILIAIVNFLVRNYIISGILVSTLSMIVACVYLYKLVNIDFNKQVAFNAVKFLVIFPFSFFLGLVFSDSLFIALTIMTFYYMRKRKWFLTGVLGGLASLTRNFGILLLVPVAIEYFAETKFIEMLKEKNWKQIFSDLIKRGSNLLLIPLGQFTYLLINKVVTGNWLTFLTYQNQHWCHELKLNVAANLGTHLTNALTWKPADTACMWAPLVILVFLIILMMFYALGKIRISYIAYTFAYLFLCLTITWLISGGRYLMGIFPIYLITALLARNRFSDLVLTLVFILGLCCYTIAYVMGLYVY
jgi:hypothetical protein